MPIIVTNCDDENNNECCKWNERNNQSKKHFGETISRINPSGKKQYFITCNFLHNPIHNFCFHFQQRWYKRTPTTFNFNCEVKWSWGKFVPPLLKTKTEVVNGIVENVVIVMVPQIALQYVNV